MTEPETISAPEDFAVAFIAAWNAGDAERLGALFVEDADFVNVVGLWWRRRRQIVKAHGYAFARYFRHAELETIEIKTRRLGDAAVSHAQVRMTGQTGPDGGLAGPRETILSFTLERSDDGWRAVSAQNTEVSEGMETQIAGAGGPAPIAYPRG